MCLIICRLCNEEIGFETHTCDPEKIANYINQLKQDLIDSGDKLECMANAVFMVLKDLPKLDGNPVEVSPVWLQRLWEAVEGKYYKADTADLFIIQSLAKQQILCAAYELFRDRKGKTLLEKLQRLKETCDNSVKALGYDNTKSPFTITPEDIVNKK